MPYDRVPAPEPHTNESPELFVVPALPPAFPTVVNVPEAKTISPSKVSPEIIADPSIGLQTIDDDPAVAFIVIEFVLVLMSKSPVAMLAFNSDRDDPPGNPLLSNTVSVNDLNTEVVPDMFGICHGLFNVIVCPVFNPVVLNTTVSCGRGKLVLATAPPEVAAQELLSQLPPLVLFQYTVLAAVNVIPVLLPRLPSLVPVSVVPDTVMSPKSTSVIVIVGVVPIVNVLAVPRTSLINLILDPPP